MTAALHLQVPVSCNTIRITDSSSWQRKPHPFSDGIAAVSTLKTGEGKKSSLKLDRRSAVLSGITLVGYLLLEGRKDAWADIKILLSNMQAIEVPCPEGQTTVTGGTSFGATCFRVTGDATNPASQPVYNADVFGRVYDAEGEPALDAAENLRIDTIPEIPPGKSKVSFQITVNAAQAKLGPLELKNFKATGFLGKVNNKQGTGRLDDIDFSELDGPDDLS